MDQRWLIVIGKRNSFSVFLLVAFALLSQNLETYVEGCCPERFTVSSSSLQAPNDPASYTTTRIGTKKVFVPPSNRRLIAEFLSWLYKCNSSSMCDIHERFILEFDRSRRKLIPFGTYSKSDDIHLYLSEWKPGTNTPSFSSRCIPCSLAVVVWKGILRKTRLKEKCASSNHNPREQ